MDPFGGLLLLVMFVMLFYGPRIKPPWFVLRFKSHVPHLFVYDPTTGRAYRFRYGFWPRGGMINIPSDEGHEHRGPGLWFWGGFKPIYGDEVKVPISRRKIEAVAVYLKTSEWNKVWKPMHPFYMTVAKIQWDIATVSRPRFGGRIGGKVVVIAALTPVEWIEVEKIPELASKVAESIDEVLTKEMAEREARIAELSEKVTQLEVENATLADMNADLRAKLLALEALVNRLYNQLRAAVMAKAVGTAGQRAMLRMLEEIHKTRLSFTKPREVREAKRKLAEADRTMREIEKVMEA